ncbi:hypothetical protein Gpo141_00002320 [Globisporangium polare]
MSSSSSDDDDEDYVPQAERKVTSATRSSDEAGGDATEAAQTGRVTASARVSDLWADINASTSVSQKATDRTAKYLKGLTSKKQPKAKKKRKLHEFQCPVLSLDVTRSREDMRLAGATVTKVDQVVKFAGVEYSVSKTVRSSAGAAGKAASGLDQVLASLDAPKKVSTMEKTSLDWDKFKEVEGIEDELQQYTKDGYLEKQDFLQRVDLKQFELEKAARDKKRKLQEQSQPQ